MYEKARALDDKDYLNWGNLGDALYWMPGRREESYRRLQDGDRTGASRLQSQSQGRDRI